MTLWRQSVPLAAAVVLAAPAVRAQNPTEEARAAFQEGVREYSARRFAQALEAFRRAYRVRPHPSVLVNIANCYAALDQPQQAIASFERYLADSGASVSQAQREQIQTAIAQARRRLATITVITRPAGADVFVDGDLVGTSPLRRPLELAAGPHVLEARMQGGSALQHQARVEAGGSLTVTLDLTVGRSFIGMAPPEANTAALQGSTTPPTPTPPPTPPVNPPPTPVPGPTTNPTTPPTVTASVVPTTRPTAPPRTSLPPAETHLPTLPPPVPPSAVQARTGNAPAGQSNATTNGSVTVRSGAGLTDTRPVRRTRRGAIPAPVWIGAGVTLAATGVAIGFGVYTLGLKSDFDDAVRYYNSATDAELRNYYQQRGFAIADAVDQNRLVTNIAIGVAVAGGLFTVGSLLFWPRARTRSSAPPAARVQLLPSLDGRGLVLGGVF